MILHKVWIAILLLFTCVCSAQAKVLPYRLDCDLGKGSTQTLRIESLTVLLIHSGNTCHFRASNLQGNLLFETEGTGIQVSSALTADEGGHFLVIQNDSSPNHLVVLGLGIHPRVLANLMNGYGFWIENGCIDGRWHLWTADDAFQGEPELADVYHQDIFVPELALDIRNDKVVDVTSSCRFRLDRRIARIRSAMTMKEVDAFRNRRIKDAFRAGQVKGYILSIVFDYLYSGRGKIAQAELHRMWPADDEQRTWHWILRKRSEGLLKRLNTARAM